MTRSGLHSYKVVETGIRPQAMWFHSLWLLFSCSVICVELFYDLMDSSIPDSSVYGVLQARILEWLAISFSRGSSRPKDQTWFSCLAGRWFTDWAMREALKWFTCLHTQCLVQPLHQGVIETFKTHCTWYSVEGLSIQWTRILIERVSWNPGRITPLKMPSL